MYLTQQLLIIIFSLSCLAFFKKRKQGRNSEIAFSAVYFSLLLVVAFRPDTMTDYLAYTDGFEGGYSGIRLEPFFHVIKYVATLLGNPVIWGFVIYAFICVTIKYWVIRKSHVDFWPSIIVYISNILISHDMVAIRAGAAAGILLFTSSNLIILSRKRVVLLVSIATLFHYSALAFFIIIFLNPNRQSRLLFLIGLLICNILAAFGYTLTSYVSVLGNINSLKAVVEMNRGSGMMNYMNLLQLGHIAICVLFWNKANRLLQNDINALLYLKLYTIGLCVMPLFADSISIAIRLSGLFLVIEILLIPIGFKSIFGDNLFGKLMLILYASIIFYFNVTSSAYWGEY